MNITTIAKAAALATLTVVAGATVYVTAGPSAAQSPEKQAQVGTTSTAGDDSSAVTNRVPRVSVRSDGTQKQRVLHRQGEQVTPGRGTGSWTNMPDFMSFVIHDADSYWTNVLTSAGLEEPWVNYRFPLPGQSVESDCGATDDSTMKFCFGDDEILFSQDLATRLWNGTYVGPDGQQLNGQGGDFAVAFLLAHEFAHSIQHHLGLYERGYSVPQTEKHADCWSGVWAQSAESRGLLDEGDFAEGLAGAFLVGDTQYDNPQHHGNSDQRMAAFRTGFESSTPSDCDIYL